MSLIERIAAEVRPLPIALAHELIRAKLKDQDRQALLGRLFRGLTPHDKLRCHDELAWCRMAIRGQHKAEVV